MQRDTTRWSAKLWALVVSAAGTRRRLSYTLIALGTILFLGGAYLGDPTELVWRGLFVFGWVVAVVGTGIYFYDFFKG